MSDPMSNHLQLLGRYNQWINGRLYDAAAQLPPATVAAPLGAFFGSILGTLNHILVGDTIWLRRFADHPAAFAALAPLRADRQALKLDQPLFDSLGELRAARDRMDSVILAFVDALDEHHLSSPLAYRNSRGDPFERPLGSLLTHFFNHQTHHRGQVTTLLFQQGIDPGVTDLLSVIPSSLRESP